MSDNLPILDGGGNPRYLATREISSGVHAPVHHSGFVTLLSSKTRPANTTAYAAGDAIGETASVVHQFDIKSAGMPRGLIVSARLIRQDTTNITQRFRALIHDAVPASITDADNAAFPLVWANRASRMGWIDFASPATSDASGGDVAEFSGVLSNAQGIVVAPSDGIVRVVLTTRDGFTPASATPSALVLGFVS